MRTSLALPVYAGTLFLSACLLFLVQPMFARMMLPRLGGAPAVWNTAVVFYQAVLLAGYAYAHVATRGPSSPRRSRIHLALLPLPLLVLPFGLPADWAPPTDASPVLATLGMMTTAIGLPLFVVSTTAPLLQRWFASTGHRAARDPYFLYAAGNAGSLVGLLGYPLLVEPRLGVRTQAAFWAGGYALLAGLVALCRAFVRAAPDDAPVAAQTEPAPPVTRTRRLRWIALALVPSSLMLSVTTFLSNEVAPVPMLWVLPLAVYLQTFVLVFARRPPLSHATAVRALPIALTAVVVTLCSQATGPLALLVVAHLLGLFAACMVCHGELAADRPAPEHLTDFYMCLSIGGVAGGALNAFLAPVVFTSVAEYPIAIVAAALSMPRRDGPPGLRPTGRDLAVAALGAALTLGLVILHGRLVPGEAGTFFLPIVFGLPYLVAYVSSKRPVRYALTLAGIFLAARAFEGEAGSVLHAQRSFFGIHRVTEPAGAGLRYLMHGSTTHGVQIKDPTLAREPVGYYARTGPLGDVMSEASREAATRVALVGLGAGAAAAYGAPGQRFDFFEIDPVVRDIASNPRFFGFLAQAKADVRVLLGDGRLRLAAEPDGSYDVLVVDAYSSESPPLHLMTAEAFALYRRKVRPDGLLAFHISNRHVELEPVFAALARNAGIACLVEREDDPGPGALPGTMPSIWAVATTNEEALDRLRQRGFATARLRDDVPLWTDDYASLISLLR